MRFLTRIPRPAVLLAAGLATALLGTVAALGPSAALTSAAPTPAVTATLPGDDNGDGRIEEDETGFDCHTMGNRLCGADVPPECEGAGAALELCVTVASRAPYGWENADGSRVDIPAGRAVVLGLDEKPGTTEFMAALDALDAEYREHAPRH
ncbi:hypothetical protein ACFQ6U_14105 [Streptomyces sp. NPDC056465]|uniref:hypothetical protein n=1 Tax=Streptomyces sp. NPDC056465 TaxID=3345829 RepID=UPI0036D1E693